jgi:DNA-binding response OmpR family regulator
MREPTEHKTALLVTCDAAVETAAREEAAANGDEIKVFQNSREAMSIVLNGCCTKEFAIVDLEAGPSRRTLLETAAGTLPVLAITAKDSPWLSSMLRRRRIGATLVKPFSTEEWREAFRRVREMSAQTSRSWA